MHKYCKLDKSIEVMRYSFFLGVQEEGSAICGTCKHFETLLNDDGNIKEVGGCSKKCIVSGGIAYVHSELNASIYMDDGIETAYEEYKV